MTVRHTATTGARRSGPERTGKAEVREIAVPVNPEKLCVQPNEEIRIFHTVEGIEDQRVTWQTDTVPSGGDAGTVENGFFVAPGSPAIVEITATSVAEPQAKGRVQVRVGGCTCWWTVSIDGNLVVGKDEEDTASFTSVDDGLVINLVSQEGVVFLQRAGDVHSWFVSGSTLGINPPDLSYGTGEDEPVSGTLLDFTDTVVEGQIRGLVTILRVTNTGSEERLANFSAQFRVQANPLLSPLKACVVGEEIISP